MQASLLIALSLLKRERDVTINTFTAEGTLATVHLDKTMTWESALEHLDKNKVSEQKVLSFQFNLSFFINFQKEKTKTSLKIPLVVAKERKQKVDVFVTIVDSIGRACPNKEPPTQELMDYRKACAQPFAK
jgi:hypothetical protein